MSACIFSVFLFICNVKNKVSNSEKMIFTFGFTPKKAFIELKVNIYHQNAHKKQSRKSWFCLFCLSTCVYVYICAHVYAVCKCVCVCIYSWARSSHKHRAQNKSELQTHLIKFNEPDFGKAQRCGVLSDKQHWNFACLDGTRTGIVAVS